MTGSEQIATGGVDRRPPAIRAALAVGWVLALIPLGWFDRERRQIGLYGSWLVAMLLYLMQWPRPRGLIQWRPSRWLQVALAIFACGLFAAFCLIYDNWRWAATGDSLPFYDIGDQIARGNPAINLLSVRGVFESYTVVQATLQGVFMHVSPTLFAHRLGNLLTSTLLVIAAALLAAQTSGATVAVLVGLFLPLNYVFDVFTMLSLNNLTGVLPYYGVYTLFVACCLRPNDFSWAALGLACGLAFYFPPLWSGAVAVVSAGVVLVAVRRRAPRGLVIWVGGVLVALLPGLLQAQTLLNVWLVHRPTLGLTVEYFLRILWQVLTLAVSSELVGSGASGAWVRPPLGYLFLAGVGLATASAALALWRRPRARTLQYAWVWLGLFALDAVGLSLANSGYPVLSVKRAIVLLPSMTFFVVLPLAWLAERVARPWFTVAITIAALAPYAYLNATWLWWGMEYGFNIGDGMVHITQTAPGGVLLVSPHKDLHKDFGSEGDPNDLIERMFHVREHTVVTSRIPTSRGDFDRVVCFSTHFDGREWTEQVRGAVAQLCPGKPVDKITSQLQCVTCDPP